MDVKAPPAPVVRTGSGERGSVSVSGIEGRGRAIRPSPPKPPWYKRVMQAVESSVKWGRIFEWVIEKIPTAWIDLISGLFRQWRLRGS